MITFILVVGIIIWLTTIAIQWKHEDHRAQLAGTVLLFLPLAPFIVVYYYSKKLFNYLLK